ncbi:MAG TPA: GNAT family N-acetyltransferase [Rhizomicrobium sp.]|jgi:amino-acid N-acetyltransferase|nr:GNAT family N-acetyltransferase [Rhizomicrobium sp.]
MTGAREDTTVVRIFAGDPQFGWMVEALTAAVLPATDLDEGFSEYFAADDYSGFGGFCRFGTTALLRSLVVAEGRQRQGTGSALLVALVSYARAAGVCGLWLLTISTETFFARHGFRVAERADAPPTIANTSQFRDLCPASAALMHKSIA